MKILLIYLALLLMLLETETQITKTTTISRYGNSLPYTQYFDVYQGQWVTVTFSTRCPYIKIDVLNSSGGSIARQSGTRYSDGYYYNFNFWIGVGNGQSLSLVDWTGNKSCIWSFNFNLAFSCGIVTQKCYDCSSYKTCTLCSSGYFLYNNTCYLNIPNCQTRYELTCTECFYGYVLVNGVCNLCSLMIPNCQVCVGNLCDSCKSGYNLQTGNLSCKKCQRFIPKCLTCNNNTSCTSCAVGYALADPTTCQLCSVSLPNCLNCTGLSICTSCTFGYALTVNSTCQLCSTFIPDCILCSSSSYCLRCSPGLSYSPSACAPCMVNKTGCATCVNNLCASCYNEYYYQQTIKSCIFCNITMVGCERCTNESYCTTCAVGYCLTIYGIINNCTACSIIPQCLTCTNNQTCTSCIDTFILNGTVCTPCSSFMTGCLDCNTITNCITCIDTGFVLANGCCLPCQFWLDECQNCSDHLTCTTCQPKYMLVNNSCKPCFSLIQNCKTCSNETFCTGCQIMYQVNITTGTCQLCSLFIPNCTICSSQTVCTQCLQNTVLVGGKCIQCGKVLPHCLRCISSTTCALCDQGYVPSFGICQPCSKHINHCSNCFDTNYCQQCFDPYISNNVKKCECKFPLYNVSDFCLADKNCVSAYSKNGIIYCSFCNIGNLFYIDANHQCVCKTGYKRINDQCVVFCGDGIVITEQCDDNNTLNGDGCSSDCKIQLNFICTKLPTGVSYCRVVKDVILKYDYTFKMMNENKGRMYISLSSKDPVIIKCYLSSFFKFTIMHNRSNSLNISSFEINSEGIIIIDIDYNETIQNSSIQLKFMFDPSFIVSQDCVLNFSMKGTNYPLVISEFYSHYQSNSNLTKYFMLFAYAFALLLLFSDKFIAVQGINTIQLTFFSFLLIYADSDWPMVISALLPLKFSTGFNQLVFQPNPYDNINNNAFRKFQYIGISSYFIGNNLINSITLLVVFSISTILFSIKTRRQNNLVLIKDGFQLKKLTSQLEKIRKVFRKVHNITFNFSYIMILQVVVSIYVEFSFLKTISHVMMVVNKLLSMLTLTIIIVTILENFKHFFLSVKDTYAENFQVGSWEARYRRIYFIYILINAICMFFLNDKILFTLKVSFYVLIFAIIYLLLLVIYRPYRHSFSIHGFTICLNQIMFIFALLLINIINFNIKLQQTFFLVFNYLIMGFSVVVIFLMTVRVFFEWKYGEEQVLKRIKYQLQMEKQKQEKILLNKAAKNLNKKINKKNQGNQYLYSNQKEQVDKIDYLNDLKNKRFLSDWQKDHAYSRIYDHKPLHWVYQNQTEEKYKFLLQIEKQRFQKDVEKQQMIKKKNEKLLNTKYIEQMQKIKQKLRNQYVIRQAKKQQKKQQKRAKNKSEA